MPLSDYAAHAERERRREVIWFVAWQIAKALIFIAVGVFGTLWWMG